ncbi:carboxymuconolactone decarboxylase family protein [Streptomyces sp. NPDC088706]|uniref:carboxymuconolactone decarboxylase family protein n=1 Tax=Streptomyces sp. NPDC088706 TaxID=3365870 RepID=UPI0037FBE653
MNARLNVLGSPATATILKHLMAAGQAVSDTGLSSTTQELVKIRAGQINRCVQQPAGDYQVGRFG